MTNEASFQAKQVEFLKNYWQKQPAFFDEGAVADLGIQFKPIIEIQDLMALAQRDDVESRLVIFDAEKNQWILEHGPFEQRKLRRLEKMKGWTLLVQGVNLYSSEADKLLRQFSFVPYARLDDLMISFSPEGGTVGPHFDHYDVFLLQGMGAKNWKVSEQKDRTLLENVPLKILRSFDTTQSWNMQTGQMLYLPPHLAHYGTALNQGMTYSIGFRAPTAREVADSFLTYLQDNLDELALKGQYEDPNLVRQIHPAEISTELIHKYGQLLQQIVWNENMITHFVGQYLTEPKHNVFFNTPKKELTFSQFKMELYSAHVKLPLTTQMLFFNNMIFMNGEGVICADDDIGILTELADKRNLLINKEISKELMALFYEWYKNGFIRILRAAT